MKVAHPQTAHLLKPLRPPVTLGQCKIKPHRISFKVQATSENSNTFERLGGIKDLVISNKYDAWFLDQFGVLHDGKKAYPGAVHCLEKIAESGSRIILISNSSKRAQVTFEKLPKLGFDPKLFCGIVTSGEMTFNNLLERKDPWFNALGNKCIHFTWGNRGAISLEGLNLKIVDNVCEADFLLAHGTEAIRKENGDLVNANLKEMERILFEASKCSKNLPLIVANPDLVTVEERDLRVMPGSLGKMYAEFGGQVKYMGKPDPVIYEACQEMLGISLSKSIAVGDSLHHDIQGANRVGMASVFVGGGIHAQELLIKNHGDDMDGAALNDLIDSSEWKPDFVIPCFSW